MANDVAIGVIGVGRMGSPIARRLLRAGHKVYVTDTCPTAATDLIEIGAVFKSNAASVAETCDFLFCSLPGPRELEEVVFGCEGVLQGVKAGAVLIDLGTNPVDLLLRIEKSLRERSAGTIAAPTSKGVEAAETGQLTVFVGGARECRDLITPLLDTISSTIFVFSDIRSAIVCKLATNLLWYSHATVIGEAIAMCAGVGLDPECALEVIRASSGTSWTAEKNGDRILAGDYDLSFNLALCCKDLRITIAESRALGLDLKVGELVSQRYHDARTIFGDDAGQLSVVRLQRS